MLAETKYPCSTTQKMVRLVCIVGHQCEQQYICCDPFLPSHLPLMTATSTLAELVIPIV